MICLVDFYIGVGVAIGMVFIWIFKKLAESRKAD
jgi:hypothetical protein